MRRFLADAATTGILGALPQHAAAVAAALLPAAATAGSAPPAPDAHKGADILGVYELWLSDGQRKRRVVVLPALNARVDIGRLSLALVSLQSCVIKYNETDPFAPSVVVLEDFEVVRMVGGWREHDTWSRKPGAVLTYLGWIGSKGDVD